MILCNAFKKYPISSQENPFEIAFNVYEEERETRKLLKLNCVLNFLS